MTTEPCLWTSSLFLVGEISFFQDFQMLRDLHYYGASDQVPEASMLLFALAPWMGSLHSALYKNKLNPLFLLLKYCSPLFFTWTANFKIFVVAQKQFRTQCYTILKSPFTTLPLGICHWPPLSTFQPSTFLDPLTIPALCFLGSFTKLLMDCANIKDLIAPQLHLGSCCGFYIFVFSPLLIILGEWEMGIKD